MEDHHLGRVVPLQPKDPVGAESCLRDVETPAFDAGIGPNVNMDGIDSRTAVQLTHIF